MVPLITSEAFFGAHVSELVFGVNIFDLDFWVQIDSIKYPIKSNSVGSGNVSHCRASSLYDHLDHCFVVWGIWLSDLVFPGLCDAIEASTSGALSLHRETKFTIGFDFAVTLSSAASFCFLFDITSRQLVELKWLMLNKHKRWFHASLVNFPLLICLRVGFVVNVFDLDLGVQIYSVKQPIKPQLCGFLTRVSSLDFCLWWSFWSLLHCLQKCTTGSRLEMNVRLWERDPHATKAQHLGFPFVQVWVCFADSLLSRICFQMLDELVSWCCLSNATLGHWDSGDDEAFCCLFWQFLVPCFENSWQNLGDAIGRPMNARDLSGVWHRKGSFLELRSTESVSQVALQPASPQALTFVRR